MKTIINHIEKELIDASSVNLIISGGNSPNFFLKKLSTKKKILKKINIFLSDERLVDKKSEFSNYNHLKSNLKKSKIFSPQDFKNNRNKKIQFFNKLKNKKVISIIGIGEDGHYASIFNNSKKIKSLIDTKKKPNILITEKIGKPKLRRVTVNLSTILLSKKIFIIINTQQKKKLFIKCIKNKLNPLYSLVKYSNDNLLIYNANSLKRIKIL